MSNRVKGFKSLSGGKVLDKVQENVDTALGPLQDSRIVEGLLLRNVQLTAGSNTVAHKLDRRLIGWIVVRKRANEQIWDEQDTNNAPKRTLKLQASGAVTVDLWVF